MNLYKNANVEIKKLQDASVLIQHWSGYASSDNFRLAIKKSIELVADRKIYGIISDARSQAVVKPEDAQYAAEAMPKLMEAGLKAMAFVVPESVFTQMSLDKFKINTEEQSGNTRYFDNIQSAEDWIKEIIA